MTKSLLHQTVVRDTQWTRDLSVVIDTFQCIMLCSPQCRQRRQGVWLCNYQKSHFELQVGNLGVGKSLGDDHEPHGQPSHHVSQQPSEVVLQTPAEERESVQHEVVQRLEYAREALLQLVLGVRERLVGSLWLGEAGSRPLSLETLQHSPAGRGTAVIRRLYAPREQVHLFRRFSLVERQVPQLWIWRTHSHSCMFLRWAFIGDQLHPEAQLAGTHIRMRTIT